MVLSKEMVEAVNNGSAIRKMFEAGALLRKEYGDKVCDFSIGNPDLAPPACIAKALKDLAEKVHEPASLGYMPNAGFPFARNTLANYLSTEQNTKISEDDVLLTCGAAGAIQVFFNTVLDPQDEVLGISPYFIEYDRYVSCSQGIFKPVPALEDFNPDFEALEKAITPKTRALLINSPNNPTGMVYNSNTIQRLIKLVEEASIKHNRMIYLLSDEPYRFLAYEDEVPSLLDKSAHCVVLGSFSKNLALAGERIGYIALSPLLEERALLMAGLVQAHRFLGFVNAPIVGQYLMHEALSDKNLHQNLANARDIYLERRNIFASILDDAGIEYNLPKGAFYFFPKSPIKDVPLFLDHLKNELILAVNGKGFGKEGHFRLSFAVENSIIEQSRQGFINATKKK